MRNVKASKRIFSFVIAVLILLCQAVPVMASNYEESQTQGQIDGDSYSGEADGNYSDTTESNYTGTAGDLDDTNSITVPFTFDGSEPDLSQVEVDNSASEPFSGLMTSFMLKSAGTEADSAMPEKVETKMISMNEGDHEDIKLVTADRYFLYTPPGESAPVRQFYAELSGIPRNYDTVKISVSEDGNGESITLYSSYGGEIYCDDISTLFNDTGDTQEIYVSVWRNSEELYRSEAVTVRYVQDSVADTTQRYVSADAADFYMNASTPLIEGVSGGDDIVLKMTDSNGKVVGMTLSDINEVYHNTYQNNYDTRYKAVFKNYYNIRRNYQNYSGRIYRAAEWKTGKYGLIISVNGVDRAVYNNLFEVVNGVVVDNLQTAAYSGFPPVLNGDRETYIKLTANNINKDDFTVLITDDAGDTIGRSTSSRYTSGNEAVYKVALDDGITFSSDNRYYIELISEKPLYYNGNSTNLNVHGDYFDIYSFNYNYDRNEAEFILKVISPPEEAVTAELLYNDSGNEVSVASGDFLLENETVIRFKDESGNILKLSQGQYTLRIRYEKNGSVYTNSWGFYINSFETSVSRYTSKRPFFYIEDSSIPFDVVISEQAYNITDSSEFDVILKDSNGTTVGTADGELTVSDVEFSYWNEGGENVSEDAKELIGNVSLIEGADLKDGNYYLHVMIDGADKLTIRLSGLLSSKVYSTGSYPQFVVDDSGVQLDGYAYMLKKDMPYDGDKFSYTVTDLLGNPVNTAKPTVNRPYDSVSIDEYYKINSVITDNIPAAYYRLKLQYDGKDLYELYNPSELVYSGYSSLKKKPVSPEVSSWYGYGDGISGFRINGILQSSDSIKVLVYDSSNMLEFDPVKVITPAKAGDNSNLYSFTSSDLEGLDLSKEYQVIVLLNDVALSSIENILSADDSEVIPVTGVSLDNSTLDIRVDETRKLNAAVEPAGATNKKVTWASSNEAVATVDAAGNVTGVAPGTATITVTTQDGGKQASCTVTVSANIAELSIDKLTYGDEESTEITAVDGVYNVDGAKFPLTESVPLQLMLKGANYNAAKEYDFTITVNGQTSKTGMIRGSELLGGFTLDIVRGEAQADGSYTYKVIITEGTTQVAAVSFVLNISGTPIPVTGVALNRHSLKIDAGKTATLQAVVSPSNATNKKVTWTSSDPMVAEVDPETGEVTAKGVGTAEITVTTEDGGKTDKCTVNVTVSVSGVLKYGDVPASGVWVMLYKDNTYVTGKYTDANGAFTLSGLSSGNYTIQAYSTDRQYNSLNQELRISKYDSSVDDIAGFESIYDGTAALTIAVTDLEGNALGSSYQVYVVNYETGYSEYISDDGSKDSIVIANVPYMGSGSEYSVYLYTNEELGYFYDMKTVTVGSSAVQCSFMVRRPYIIRGNVKDNTGEPVQFAAVKVAKGSDVIWVYTDMYGNFIASGIYNTGEYTVSVDDSRYSAASTEVTVPAADPVELVVLKGMTLTGRVLKNGEAAYKAYVYVTDTQDNWVAGGYSTGDGGFVFDGAIKEAGRYILNISGVYAKNGMYQRFVSEPLEIEVTENDIAEGRMSVDIEYADPVRNSQIFTGSGNSVATDISVVRSGSLVNLVVKYRNNGNTATGAQFTVELPAGLVAENSTFSVENLQPGEAGQKTIALSVNDSITGDYITIPVKVIIGSDTYDFGTVSLEVANATINAPGAVRTTDNVIVYGEATQGSSVTVKNAITGEVLGVTTPVGRWYKAQLMPLPEGEYYIVAETVKGGVSAKSPIVKIVSKADQISLDKVVAKGSELSVNKLIGVRTFSAWVDLDLNGEDIDLAVLFENGDTISNVTYHFSDMDFAASKDAGGYWKAVLKGWSGGGLKNITATVDTADGRSLTFIIAEVTVLIDPSGYVTDTESGDRLAGVTVICDIWNNGAWEQWDAELYGQVNPQITDANGNYGWMVPAGTYRVRAFKEGFDGQISEEIVIPPVRTDVNFALTPAVPVESIVLDKTEITVSVGGTQTISATAEPADAANAENIRWTSSNPAVATVSNGVVTGISAGTAVVTAKAGSRTAECVVTVTGGGSSEEGGNTGGGTGDSGGSSEGGNGGSGGPVILPPTDTEDSANPVAEADNTGKAKVTKAALAAAESLTVKADKVELVFDKAAVETLKNSQTDLEISVKKAGTTKLSAEAKALVGNRPVYEINVTAGGKAITDFGGGLVSISIPYTAGAGEDPNAIVVYYIDSKGNMNVVVNGVYDPETRTVTFTTGHFSMYAVGYNKKAFPDVPAWAEEYVTFLAARGLVNGIGDGQYGANSNITRADFVTLLARIAGADLRSYKSSSFTDVDSGAYYAGAVAWAFQNGITSGTGNGKFSPKANITRQDMAVMIQKFVKVMGYELPKVSKKTTFADQSEISSYAAEAVSALQQAGIIEGRTAAGNNGKVFAPKDNATRSETAKIMTIVIRNMAK